MNLTIIKKKKHDSEYLKKLAFWQLHWGKKLLFCQWMGHVVEFKASLITIKAML